MTSLLGALVVLVVLTAGSPPAGAQDVDDPFEGRGSWTLTPTGSGTTSSRAHFVLDARPGQTIEDSVTLANLTDAPLSFQIYSADAYNTEHEGAFAVRQADEPKESVGGWVRLAIDAYTVQPGTQVEIPFAIDVPDNVEPGDHTGGIVALNVNPEGRTGSDEVGVDVLRAIGARVYLRVPGELDPAVDLVDVSVAGNQPIVPYVTGRGSATIDYELANTGNVRIRPTATIRVTGPFGVTVKTFDTVELPELLPGNRTAIRQHWEGVTPLGPLTVEITLDGEGGTVVRQASFWAVPWLLLVVLAALVVLAVVWRRRRRSGGRHATRGRPPVAPRDERDDRDERELVRT